MTHRVTSFEVLGRERNRSRDPKEGGVHDMDFTGDFC